MNPDPRSLLSDEGKAKLDELTQAADKAAVTGDRTALERLEAAVRQATVGSAKGPRPTPPVQSPRKKARIAAREARRLNRKRSR